MAILSSNSEIQGALRVTFGVKLQGISNSKIAKVYALSGERTGLAFTPFHTNFHQYQPRKKMGMI